VCSNFFYIENRAVYEIRRKNIVEPDNPQMTIIAHAHCVLDNQGYRHTFRLYVGKSISELQIQVATHVFELSAGICHR